jgi:hypothetical protein
VVISRHVEWMADAEAITFDSVQRQGVGTAFQTATKVGPFRLMDHMVVTEWEPARVMGIRHTGVVTGTGRFTLEPESGSPEATRFTWEENLRFPAWMGGGLGGRLGGAVLKRIWRRNLDNLRRRFE